MIVDIHLTRAQQNRLRKGLAVRVGADALEGQTQLAVTEALAKRIESSRRRGKGLQIKASDILDDYDDDEEQMMMGGKLRIGKAFKNLGKSVSKGFDKTTGTIRKEARRDIKEIQQRAPGAIKQASHETGRFAQQAKKYVPKEVIAIPLEAGVVAGTTFATGNPQAGLMAGRASRAFVDSVYETDLARGSVGRNLGKNFAKNLVVGEVKNAVRGGYTTQPQPVRTTASYAPVPMAQAVPVGSGIRPLGGRLIRGSPEAKAYMASIRKKKYNGVGLNFGKTVQHHVRDIEGRMRSNPNNISLTMAGDDMGGDFMARKIRGTGFLPL